MEGQGKFEEFMKMNRELLDCYGGYINADQYKQLNIKDQRDFCYSYRVRVEEQLIKGKITPQDFFNALPQQQ